MGFTRDAASARILLFSALAWLGIFASISTLASLDVVGIGLRGEFHRTHSHRDDNVAFDPELGHAPVLRPGDEAAGVILSQTIGQRLETIDPAREHVAVLGDSVLYGWGVGDDETSAALLASRVHSAQVINLSVSGYSIDQYYLYLQRHLHRLKAKLVIVGIYAGNDYESAAMSHWSGHSTPLFVLDGDGLALFREHTPRLNCIDVVSGSLLFKPLWADFDFAMSLLSAVCHVRTLDEDEHEEVVRRLLRDTAKLVESQGSRLLYVLLPDFNDFNKEAWYWREKSKYGDLARLLEEGEYDVLWFYDELATSGGSPAEYFIEGDSAHLNQSGHTLLADRLEVILRERYGIE